MHPRFPMKTPLPSYSPCVNERTDRLNNVLKGKEDFVKSSKRDAIVFFVVMFLCLLTLLLTGCAGTREALSTKATRSFHELNFSIPVSTPDGVVSYPVKATLSSDSSEDAETVEKSKNTLDVQELTRQVEALGAKLSSAAVKIGAGGLFSGFRDMTAGEAATGGTIASLLGWGVREMMVRRRVKSLAEEKESAQGALKATVDGLEQWKEQASEAEKKALLDTLSKRMDASHKAVVRKVKT